MGPEPGSFATGDALGDRTEPSGHPKRLALGLFVGEAIHRRRPLADARQGGLAHVHDPGRRGGRRPDGPISDVIASRPPASACSALQRR